MLFVDTLRFDTADPVDARPPPLDAPPVLLLPPRLVRALACLGGILRRPKPANQYLTSAAKNRRVAELIMQRPPPGYANNRELF